MCFSDKRHYVEAAFRPYRLPREILPGLVLDMRKKSSSPMSRAAVIKDGDFSGLEMRGWSEGSRDGRLEQ